MTDWQIYLTLGVIAVVVVVIAFDLIDMAVATLLGVVIMVVSGILDETDFLKVQGTAGGVVALLFGGMVVARVLETSGVFASLGVPFLRMTRGSGRRFLLLVVAVVAVVCAFLPNAATVVLLAPLVIRAAQALGIGFVGPMVLMAIVSNAAGLLTLVGDPATYLVGSAIGMSFGQYLRQVSLGGLLAVVVIVPLLPLLMKEVWQVRRALPPHGDLVDQPRRRRIGIIHDDAAAAARYDLAPAARHAVETDREQRQRAVRRDPQAQPLLVILHAQRRERAAGADTRGRRSRERPGAATTGTGRRSRRPVGPADARRPDRHAAVHSPRSLGR
jgi:MFS family permease